jgi:hypothetical protein
MKTISTKHIKKLQENTKIIDINELIHSKKYTFLVTIMDFLGTNKNVKYGKMRNIKLDYVFNKWRGIENVYN